MRNIRLTIEYDGTDFFGWQVQTDVRTVEGEIQSRLSILLGEKVKLIGAGRTDRGCHAVGQVASFNTETSLPAEKILRGLNALLDRDVRVRRVEDVELGFDARRDAKMRVYEYIVFRGFSALWRRNAWCIPYDFNLIEMNLASKSLVGTHDFSSFACSGSPRRDNITHVFHAEWKKWKEGAVFKIEAKGFLRGMVCAIVGTCLEIGKGKFAKDRMRFLLDAKDRHLAGPAAPAHGLYLVKVVY